MAANTGTDAGADPGQSTVPATIAAYQGVSQFFNGLIDELELFNRALTQSEIQKIFDAGSAGKCPCTPAPSPGMISWWPGDNSTDDIQGGNNGTFEGGATYGSSEVRQAFSFNGVDQDVLIGNPANLKLSPSFTIDAWINPNSIVDFRAVLSKWGQSAALDNYAVWLEDAEQWNNRVNAQWVVSGAGGPFYYGISGGTCSAEHLDPRCSHL